MLRVQEYDCDYYFYKEYDCDYDFYKEYDCDYYFYKEHSGRDGLSGRAVRVLESVLELSAIAQDGHAAHGRARAALLGDLGGAGGAALPTNAVEVAVTLDAASLLVSRAAAEVASCEAIYHQLCDAAESGKPGESGREAAESGSVALPGPLPAEGVRGEVRDEVRDEVLGGQAGGESLSRAPMNYVI
ncbi:hypothetical protein T492DRAFT_833763 [Pavlovales sp. CCMP2436]|nr:hypothetical protein T492DRAFT_833763 [Pavlovales sp. CCMP2436]